MKALVIAALAVGATCPTVLAGTIEDVRSRDRLICGVSEGLRGFSAQDEAGAWQGFDVDFCKAVALAVLGSAEKVDYIPLSTDSRFSALSTGSIDLLSRNSTWTMSRDLQLGLDFAGISYFDGQGFLVPALFGVSSALELEGAKICVVSGTTTQTNATAYFAAAGLNVTFLPFAERPAARAAYAAGQCDAYTADRSALAGERSQLAVPADHIILPDVISKEPLGPVVRDKDSTWRDLVRWTLFALVNAEELGLGSATIDEAIAVRLGSPAAAALGLEADWLAKIIAGTGNYGEIFERNLGHETPLELARGINALWTQGGLLYAPPMQ